MKPGTWRRIRATWRTEFCTPKDFVKRAIMIAAAFGLAHLLGLREFTSLLNGTTGSTNMSWQLAIFLGLIYIVLYFALVILAPILLIAAGLLKAGERLRRKSVA